MNSVSIVLFLGILISFGAATPVLEGKAIGKVLHHEGEDIVLNSGQFSYVVNLEIKALKGRKSKEYEYLTCGGVIIKSDVVLTAAHCVGDDKLKPEIFAWAGIVDIGKEKGKGQRILVKSYKKHENFVNGYYNLVNYPNDIAILWLEKSFKYDGRHITQALLPKTKLNVQNKEGWIVGWGMTECGEVSDMLRKARLRVITQNKCRSYFSATKITNKQFCAMSDKQDAQGSKGDSGGPFIVNRVVVGICSYATRLVTKSKKGEDVVSCNPQKPSIYTDVSLYIDWINEKLKDGPPA